MPKLHFSIKGLRTRTILFVISSSVFILLLTLFSYLALFTFNSFTKGSILLQKYVEEYFIFSSEEGSKLISQETFSEISRKFEGFLVFDELINFKERDYREIEKVWLDFGMEKDEIRAVVTSTKIIRTIPFLTSDIKDTLSQIKIEYKNTLSKTQKIDKEKIENIINTTSKLTSAFSKTMNKFIIIFILIITIITTGGLSFFSYLLFKDTNILSKILKSLSKNIHEAIAGRYERIEIVDKKSEELYPLQEATNNVISKFEELEYVKKETIQTLTLSCNELENFIQELSNTISESKNYIYLIEEEKIEEFTKAFSNLTQIISYLTNNIDDLYQNFDKFRSSSIEIFEPISTIYDIIERLSFEYRSNLDLVSSYITDTSILIKSIETNLLSNKEKIDKALSDLTRASQKLRSIGINSSIEFSRTQISGIENLKAISNKIVELSKNLSQLFGEISLTISETDIKIRSDIDKISGFINSMKENEKRFLSFYDVIKNISSEKENTKRNIENNYNLLSEILNVFDKIEVNKESIIQEFYQIDTEIKNLVGFLSSFKNLELIFRNLEKIISGVQTTLDNLRIICSNMQKH